MKHHNSVPLKCNILFHLKSFYGLSTLTLQNSEVENICPGIGTTILNFIPLLFQLEAISLSPISKMILFILHVNLIRICGPVLGKYGRHKYNLIYFVKGNAEINNSLK